MSLEIKRHASVRTTPRRLQGAGRKGYKARKKLRFSDTHKKARYEWTLKYRSLTKEDWSKVVWSDESNFEVNKQVLAVIKLNKMI